VFFISNFKVVKCITETVLMCIKEETLFKKCIPNIILVFRYKNTQLSAV
jgi:hypothetical protein